MLIRDAIETRLSFGAAQDAEGVRARLPLSMKSDRVPVRTGMFQRLAASRSFALGDRSGVLKAAQTRSGRTFRMDVRQRVIVKALVSKHVGKASVRTRALMAHVSYLGRSGAGVDGARPDFFDRADDNVAAALETRGWSGDRHHFRFIISPEHGDRIADLRGYVREVMERVAADLGERDLRWVGACHYDTDQPHAHVLVRGRRGDGRDLVIPRDYMGYGFRARAQEVAQERLGDLSRLDAERRVWRETQAERFTALDRRLLTSADRRGRVEDGIGASDAWSALARGRLRTLEALGLATREGRLFRLDPHMEAELRNLQIRHDLVRTLNQRRLESGRIARIAGPGRLSGEVIKTGAHDELESRRFVIVSDAGGAEHYARLRPGTPALASGQQVSLDIGKGGLAQLALPPTRGFDRG